MYWQERLEWIRQTYELEPDELKTHWRQWNSIRKNMQDGFIKHQVLQTRVEIHPTIRYTYPQALDYWLSDQSNYWLNLGIHEKDNYLFDCKRKVIDLILGHSYRTNYRFPQFVIIDKKYAWAIYLTRHTTYQLTELIICGRALENKAILLKRQLEP